MTPIECIKSILENKYESEDGNQFQVELMPGLSDTEINEFKSRLPNNNLPKEIEELLRFTRGFGFLFLDEVRFDDFDSFGFEEFFPFSISLAGDGSGNFWIQDITSRGEWKGIYYVCHDPPAIVKYSNNLGEFILHIDEYGRLDRDSKHYMIYDKIVGDIWIGNHPSVERSIGSYNFPKDFLSQFPEEFVIIDLVNELLGSGFNTAKYGLNNKIMRFEDEPIWIIEMKKKKPNFLLRLFNWRN